MFLSWNIVLAPYFRVYCIFRARIHALFANILSLDLSNQINKRQFHFLNNFKQDTCVAECWTGQQGVMYAQFSALDLNLI